jgi:hypothetical protein
VADGIIVLGMHRSGTSLAAELVYRWGAYGSEEDLIQPSKWNPRGYWEYAPLVRFNDRLLHAVGSKWNVPPAEDSALLLSRLARRGSYRQEGLRLLDCMRSAGRTWFWKDPRLSILLPFWRHVWGKVAYVVVVRDPIDIALSLQARDHLPVFASLLLWQRYMVDILRWIAPERSRIFVKYDSLLDRGAVECARLSRFLRAQRRPGSCLSHRRTVQAMQGTVDPTLRRHRNRRSAENRIPITKSQRDLFDVLRGLVKRKRRLADSDLAACSPHPVWREYLIVLDTLRELSLMTRGEKQQKLFSSLPPSYREAFGG